VRLRAAAEKVVSTQDGYAVCEQLLSARFVQSVFKQPGKCTNLRKVLGPGTPKVVDQRISGDTATAAIQYDNGAVEGLFGTMTFVRDGSAWKLDRVDDVFMHSAFKASMQAFSDGALAVPEVQQCMAARADKMSDAKVRSYVYKLFRNDPTAGKTALAIAKQCPEAISIYVAERLTDIWRKAGRSEKFLRCAQRELEGLLMITGISDYALEGSDDAGGFASSAFAGLMIGVEKHCKQH
jgi:hypothetical protein